MIFERTPKCSLHTPCSICLRMVVGLPVSSAITMLSSFQVDLRSGRALGGFVAFSFKVWQISFLRAFLVPYTKSPATPDFGKLPYLSKLTDCVFLGRTKSEKAWRTGS